MDPELTHPVRRRAPGPRESPSSLQPSLCVWVATASNRPSHALTTKGINVSDITKLKAAGIVTVLGVAQTPRKNLAKIKVRELLSNVNM